MLKRSLSLMLVLAMLLAVFTILPASAAQADENISTVGTADKTTEYNGGTLSYVSDNGQITITASENMSGKITIPSSIDGLPVTAIGSEAFKDQTEMLAVVIPESVTEIGARAFLNCVLLGSVEIPQTVSVIGDQAFGYTAEGAKMKDFAIYGYKDTAADGYAAFNGFVFIDETPVTYPVITDFENTEDGVQISWDSFDGAYLYRVYYKDGSDWNRIAQVSGTSYTDTSAKDGEERVYTLRCVDSNYDFSSDYNTEGWAHTFYAPPVIKSIESTVDGVELSWDRAPGAEDYRVYRRTAGSSWTRLAQTNECSYTDTTAQSGVRYIYTLRMITADGEKFMSDNNSGKSITYVAAPVIKSIDNVDGGAKITWDEVPGADFYRIYYKNDNGGWTRLASKYLPEYVDTSVKSGESRTYTLRCLNEDEDFVSDFYRDGWSNSFINAPVITSLTSVQDGVEIRWGACAGAEKYRIYYKNGKGNWVNMAETTETSFVDTDVTSGYHYTYTVRCVNADSTRFTSGHNSGKRCLYVKVPEITSLESVEDGVKITWDECDGADFYRIYYKVGDNDWERLASKYLTEYTDTDIKNGETRVYTVRCLDEDEDFISDFNREGWSHTFYAAPKIATVSPSGSANVIKWDAVEGAAGYRLYRKELNGSWSRLFDSTTDTAYTDKTVNKDVIYAYTLRVLDADGNTVSDYIANVRHYKNGVKLDGNIYYNGTYGFKDGYQLKGLNRVNGLLRYYNSEGRMYRDTIQNTSSGYYYIDKDGICIESKEIRLAAEYMDKYCEGDTLQEKMKSGFLYMAKNYPYVRVYNDTPSDEDDVPPFAIELFEYKAGTCYRYAAAFACIAKIAGYRSRFCFGYAGSLVHGWTEVYVDGRWLNCDPDAQLPSYGFPDYYPYMTVSHVWYVNKIWYSELSFDDGEAVWGRKTYY